MGAQDVVLALVKAAVPGRQVLDPDEVLSVATSADGYMVVYCSEGSVGRTGISGTPDELQVDLTLHSFGPTRGAAQWLSSKSVTALLGQQITIPGYQPGSLDGHYRSNPIVDNDVPELPLVQIVDQLSMTVPKAS